jgi:flagellar FliL protein
MADEKNQEEAPKKKGKGKLLIIIVAVLVLVVAGVAVKMFVLGGKKKEEVKVEKKKVEHQQKQEEQVSEEDYGSPVDESNLEPVVVGPIIANLADEGGDRYLKVKIVLLESKKKEAGAKKGEGEATGVSLKDAIIRDVILNTISAKTSDDLLSVSGKEELKKEIMTSINRALHKHLVYKIYFTDFIIQ